MALLFLSLFGGALTVLSPCVLPLLPVIIGGALTQQDKKRPLIITTSLAASVTAFTLLLKWSTALISVPPKTWSIISGSLVVLLGVITLFPHLWERISTRLNLSGRSNALLQKSSTHRNIAGAVLIGVSLGPVFASCSPTYALILATVLPASFLTGLFNLIAYAVGLSAVLLLIAHFGQRLIKRLRWLANPEGWFKRVLGILFIIVGLMIITGAEKKIETALVQRGLGITQLEQRFVEDIETDMTANGFITIDPNDLRQNVEMNVRTPVPAPEIRGIEAWINSDPLTLEQLKGKVVVIDFWTYSCINCIRTLPYLNAWHETYSDDGLVLIGVHAPEFAFEHLLANVQQAVAEYGIAYPVALDNDFATWKAYSNRYWPAKYFIDREGKVRHAHFGEGDYEESEAVIRELLAEGGATVGDETVDVETDASFNENQTPETYLGYDRSARFANEEELVKDGEHVYTLRDNLNVHEWSIGGTWRIEGERMVASSDAVLRLRFTAKDVYLVMGAGAAGETTTVEVLLDGEGLAPVTIGSHTLYFVVNADGVLEGSTVELHVPAGVEMNAFTFGS
jgi:cytochrome c biogenesis protein CcdA/thiol-disulfide isomerase/thioredoxin